MKLGSNSNMNLNAQIWFNYSVHLCNTFESHPTSEELADVTLVCADQKEIKAHWSVLRNCSPMMKNLLILLLNHYMMLTI